MPILKDFAAKISVNGRELDEYDDSDPAAEDSKDAITKYIEVVPGTNFKIQCKPTAEYRRSNPLVRALYVRIFLDGVLRSRRAITNSDLKLSKNADSTYENGQKYTQNFIFSELHRSEELPETRDEEQRLIRMASKLGSIEVQIWRASGTRTSPRRDFSQEATVDHLSEKALKGSAVSHCSKLGDLVHVGASSTTSVCTGYFDPKHGPPFVTFCFKYQSHRALQTERIIPDDSVATSTLDRPLSEYTTKELRRVIEARENEAMSDPDNAEEGGSRIKHEPARSTPVKRERDEEVQEILDSARPARKPRSSRAQVIDLSDD